jgi:protein-S-isoprenylcysteine O-methyltransferase Ste14
MQPANYWEAAVVNPVSVKSASLKWTKIARRIRVPLGFGLAVVYIWLARPSLRSMIAGTVLIAAGLLLRTIASAHVRKNQELTMSGPYAYTRNPLYLGSLILAAGFALAARSGWIIVLMLVFFALIYYPVILAEEEFLAERFSEFAEYCRSVPRLVPRWRPDRAHGGGFSWALYRKHREYNSLFGSAALLAALVAKMRLRL